MKRAKLLTSLTTAAVCAMALLPAIAGAETVTGRVTEPNFMAQGFWVQATGRQIIVNAADASFSYPDERATIYRLTGTPRVTVSGDLEANSLTASSVDVLAGPRARLQRAQYTARAIPAFTSGELAPRRDR
jgi:hypothetical protein